MSDDGRLQAALAHYRDLAPRYDQSTHRIDAIRDRAIDALRLRHGETVVDAGCGTGWCVPRLLERVGSEGHVVGFDPSPEMLSKARDRLNGHADRVQLVDASGQAAIVPPTTDAILFSYTHDLLHSREALDNLFGQVRPGTRVVSVGTKLFSWWVAPANWVVRYRHRGYLTDSASLGRPWSLLESYLDDFSVIAAPLRQHYIAAGRVRARQLA